jgi:RTX calcium-binding nonapeptide repeat (4 copies)
MPAPFVLTPTFLVRAVVGTDSEPTVAAGRDGRFVIAWDDNNAGTFFRPTTVYQGPTIGAGGVGSVQTLDSSTTASSFINHDAAFLASGNVVVVGQFGATPDITFAIYGKNANGSYVFGFSGFISTANGGQFRPEIAALTGGGFVVAWENEDDDTIRFQRYDASGNLAVGVGSIPSTNSQTNGGFSFDLVALSGGGFAIADQGPGGLTGVKFSIFDANGAAVVTNIDASAQATGSAHGACTVTQLTNGNIVVAWFDLDGGGVGYRIFNSGGAALTGDLLIPGGAGATGEVPRVAPTLDGRFMVVYTGSGFVNGVAGQMVLANGALDGAAFTIDAAATAGNPEIETTADGRIVVTWSNSSDIYAAIYDPRETGVNVTGTSGMDSYVGTDNYADTLHGLGGNDALFGLGGEDLLYGGDGNDTIEGGFFADQSFGGDGDDLIYANTAASPTASGSGDTMYGDAGLDTITGSGGADYLDGGAGADSLVGGVNGDTYVVDNSADIIVEAAGEGYDVVVITNGTYTLAANLEQAVLQGGGTGATGNATVNYLYGGNSGLSLNLDGGGGDDVIFAGLAGGNTLKGGSGVDTLLIYGGNNVANGGLGDDIYYTYSSTDALSEAGGSGIDTVYATYNITLGAGFEQLLLSGAANIALGSADANIIYGNSTSGAVTIAGLAGADVIFGGAFNDALNGGSENDYLFGLGGVNTLVGGAGSDIFYCETFGNVILENAGEGFDTMYSNAAGITQLGDNVEQLILYGASTGGTGTSLGDYIYGNASANALSLEGGDGFDYILGSNQNDTFIGGFGNDSLDLRGGGAAGNDLVRYNQVGNFGADTVFGFDSDATGGQDLIDISGMGYGLVSLGSTIIIGASGGDTLITFQGATNLAGTIIRLQGVNAATVTGADFLGLV